MSKLTAIAYRHLEGEEEAVEAALKGETHDFGGELVLTFQDGAKKFVSWVGEPVQYAIGFKCGSHFLPDASLTEVDVSTAPIWAVLIGQEVSLAFICADNQVLKISSAHDHVLVCSFERGWWADELTVCKDVPAPYDA